MCHFGYLELDFLAHHVNAHFLLWLMLFVSSLSLKLVVTLDGFWVYHFFFVIISL